MANLDRPPLEGFMGLASALVVALKCAQQDAQEIPLDPQIQAREAFLERQEFFQPTLTLLDRSFWSRWQIDRKRRTPHSCQGILQKRHAWNAVKVLVGRRCRHHDSFIRARATPSIGGSPNWSTVSSFSWGNNQLRAKFRIEWREQQSPQ